jgi:hypothetical protein
MRDIEPMAAESMRSTLNSQPKRRRNLKTEHAARNVTAAIASIARFSAAC